MYLYIIRSSFDSKIWGDIGIRDGAIPHIGSDLNHTLEPAIWYKTILLDSITVDLCRRFIKWSFVNPEELVTNSKNGPGFPSLSCTPGTHPKDKPCYTEVKPRTSSDEPTPDLSSSTAHSRSSLAASSSDNVAIHSSLTDSTHVSVVNSAGETNNDSSNVSSVDSYRDSTATTDSVSSQVLYEDEGEYSDEDSTMDELLELAAQLYNDAAQLYNGASVQPDDTNSSETDACVRDRLFEFIHALLPVLTLGRECVPLLEKGIEQQINVCARVDWDISSGSDRIVQLERTLKKHQMSLIKDLEEAHSLGLEEEELVNKLLTGIDRDITAYKNKIAVATGASPNLCLTESQESCQLSLDFALLQAEEARERLLKLKSSVHNAMTKLFLTYSGKPALKAFQKAKLPIVELYRATTEELEKSQKYAINRAHTKVLALSVKEALREACTNLLEEPTTVGVEVLRGQGRMATDVLNIPQVSPRSLFARIKYILKDGRLPVSIKHVEFCKAAVEYAMAVAVDCREMMSEISKMTSPLEVSSESAKVVLVAGHACKTIVDTIEVNCLEMVSVLKHLLFQRENVSKSLLKKVALGYKEAMFDLIGVAVYDIFTIQHGEMGRTLSRKIKHLTRGDLDISEEWILQALSPEAITPGSVHTASPPSPEDVTPTSLSRSSSSRGSVSSWMARRAGSVFSFDMAAPQSTQVHPTLDRPTANVRGGNAAWDSAALERLSAYSTAVDVARDSLENAVMSGREKVGRKQKTLKLGGSRKAMLSPAKQSLAQVKKEKKKNPLAHSVSGHLKRIFRSAPRRRKSESVLWYVDEKEEEKLQAGNPGAGNPESETSDKSVPKRLGLKPRSKTEIDSCQSTGSQWYVETPESLGVQQSACPPIRSSTGSRVQEVAATDSKYEGDDESDDSDDECSNSATVYGSQDILDALSDKEGSEVQKGTAKEIDRKSTLPSSFVRRRTTDVSYRRARALTLPHSPTSPDTPDQPAINRMSIPSDLDSSIDDSVWAILVGPDRLGTLVSDVQTASPLAPIFPNNAESPGMLSSGSVEGFPVPLQSSQLPPPASFQRRNRSSSRTQLNSMAWREFSVMFSEPLRLLSTLPQLQSPLAKVKTLTTTLKAIERVITDMRQAHADRSTAVATSSDDLVTMIVLVLVCCDEEVITSLHVSIKYVTALMDHFLETGIHGFSVVQFLVALQHVQDLILSKRKVICNGV